MGVKNNNSDLSLSPTSRCLRGLSLSQYSKMDSFKVQTDVKKRLEDLRLGAQWHGDSGNSTLLPPPWLVKEKFYRAREVFRRNFFSMFFAHLSGLFLLVYIPNMLNPLHYTGNSSNLVRIFRRYVSTMRHVRKWYEGDIWNPEDPAYKSIIITRRMHKNVADSLNDKNTPTEFNKYRNMKTQLTCPYQQNVVMSQYDMALTQFSFIGVIVLFSRCLGIYCSQEDLESLVHFWRGVGYQLGIEDRFNICDGSLVETEAIFHKIMDVVWKPTIKSPLPEAVQLSKDIIQAMSIVVPFLHWTAMMKFWCGLLGLPFKEKVTSYVSFCHWLMFATFQIMINFSVFRIVFNVLLKIAYWRAVNYQNRLEKQLERLHTDIKR
ncbi:uncharacterized protein LOC143251331 [Tachypleus tridentatus]|uniref:uncharacterized protein LOC143251331 n=1 Tax=Tachypleus tridentatus TaxID=6853 RepID=UPI003FD5F413